MERGLAGLLPIPSLTRRLTKPTSISTDVKQVQPLVANGLGAQLLLRGGKEIHLLEWAMIELHLPLESGAMKGHNTAEITSLFDKKAHQLSASNPAARDNPFRHMARQSPDDQMDVVSGLLK